MMSVEAHMCEDDSHKTELPSRFKETSIESNVTVMETNGLAEFWTFLELEYDMLIIHLCE